MKGLRRKEGIIREKEKDKEENNGTLGRKGRTKKKKKGT